MKKAKKVSKENRFFSNWQLILAVSIFSAMVSGFVLLSFLLQGEEVEFSLKAVIVDQLGDEFLNPHFNGTGLVASILESEGFNVSYRRSGSVDVYKGLARHNFGIIILRCHSATRKDKTIVDFFTSEKYEDEMYRYEQDNDWLTKGYYQWKPGEFYFAVAPKFIENLAGSFPKSIVIAMGCNSLNNTCTEMAEAFIEKGATAYVGWTGLVQPAHTDNETIKLLERLLKKNETVEQAVSHVQRDKQHFSKMTFHPKSAGNLTIPSLIAETENSAINQRTASLLQPILAVCNYKANLKSIHSKWLIPHRLIRFLNLLETVAYNWLRSLSPVNRCPRSFLMYPAKRLSSKTSAIHFSKSPRWKWNSKDSIFTWFILCTKSPSESALLPV